MGVPEKKAPRLFLIDAYALIYRAYFAFINRPLTNAKGENTSAPFGFAHFLLRIREEYQPDYLAVVFDSGMSHREKEYPEYKATREKMPDDLRASLVYCRRLVEGFNDPVVEMDGYEADDVIGTLAVKAQAAGLEAVIVSGDKDFYQLIGPSVFLMNPGRGGPSGVDSEWVGETNGSERLGVPPSQVIDYLALIGDSSDNVPGAPGIGPKTAIKLLEEFGTLEAILDGAEGISGKRARESLIENRELILLSKRLVTIMKDLEVDLDLERFKVHEPDAAALRDLFMELEFRTLLERFSQEADAEAQEEEELDYRLITSVEEAKALAARIRKEGFVAFDTETTSIDPNRAKIVGASFSLVPGEAYYLPFAHRKAGLLDLDGLGESEVDNLPSLTSPEMEPLRSVLEDPSIRKIGQNLKYDIVALRRAGITVRGVWFDTMVASYVLDPGRRQHSLDALALELLGHRMISYSDVAGKGRSQIPFAEVGLPSACEYACEDADYALRLQERFAPELEEEAAEELFHEMEMLLVPVLADMELRGIRIDLPFFEEMSGRLRSELKLLEEDIHKEAGEEFNINSTQQLRRILFEKLELPVIKKTKTGASTDASVLEELAAQGHTLPQRLMEYRELEKLRSTYVDAFPQLVNPDTGRLHTSFNQTVAATGRLSSSDPNLQNIPIRTVLGREVRKGFVPDEGHVFLGADYSQVELRILAHFSGDDAFVTAFREGIDVHRQTASVIFDTSIDDVTAEMRGRAKTINFATLYGQGAFSLARQLGVARDEAAAFIDQYFERFSGVRKFLDDQVEMAKDRGYVETLSGRRRHIPELQSSNWNIRQFGERVAQNTPIQGTAADLIKLAMIRIDQILSESDLSARMLLQVHDELLFEVKEDELDALREIVVAEMEGAMELAVPLTVDVGVGKSWYECKG